MTERGRPRVSITLATYNGRHWLRACLESVAAQSMERYELLVVDDASADGTDELLREAASRDRRIRLELRTSNAGYAVAQNQALRVACGEAVLLLNQDVVLDAAFLERGLDVLGEQPGVAAVQGRMLRLDRDGARTNVVDSTGLTMHRDRRVVSRDQNRADGAERRDPGPVWGADGPAPLYRRSALLAARQPRRGGGWEILDEDFRMQKEDVDLAWRVRRLGWTAWYEPSLLAWHARGGADTGHARLAEAVRANMANPADARARAWRNQRLMQLKNDAPRAVLRDLPWIARRELAMLAWMLAADQRRLRAIPELLRLAPMALRKRRSLGKATRSGQAT